MVLEICQIISFVIMNIFIVYLFLNTSIPRLSRKKTIIISFLLFFSFSLVITKTIGKSMFVFNFIIIIYSIIVNCFLFKENILRIMQLVFIFYIVMTAADIFSAFLIMLIFDIGYNELITNSNIFILNCILFHTTAIPMYFLIYKRKMKIFVKNKHINSNSFIWLPMFNMIFIIIGIAYYYLTKEENNNIILMVILFLTLLVIVSDYLFFKSYKQDNKNILLKKDFDFNNKQSKLEYEHFDNINKQIIEIEKIQYNIKNYLTILDNLISEGNLKEAQEYLEEITKHATVEKREVCENLIINAIFCNKMLRFKEIEYDIYLDIPRRTVFENIDLASIFSNLLDNAINSCKKLPKDQKRFIKFFAVYNDRHLRIETSNSFIFENQKETNNKSGYGIKIIGGLVDKYNGSYSYYVCEDIFYTDISL